MTYNLTIVGQSNSTLEFVQNVNNVFLTTGGQEVGWLGYIILMMVFMIFFISFITASRMPVKSLTGASFITFAISLLLLAMELVAPVGVFIPLAGTALGVMFFGLE